MADPGGLLGGGEGVAQAWGLDHQLATVERGGEAFGLFDPGQLVSEAGLRAGHLGAGDRADADRA